MTRPNEHNLSHDWNAREAGREALERQRLLGGRLRTLFSGVASETLPDDFNSLLDKLPDRRGNGER